LKKKIQTLLRIDPRVERLLCFSETHLSLTGDWVRSKRGEMVEIVECVPNFSTSDPDSVKSILGELEKAKNAFLLDYTFDDYYNRLVVSFVGNKKSVLQAVLNMAFKAVELIDMRKHKGQHPRIGAVDVVPFIPSKNVTMEDCVELAKKFGKTLAEKCKVPVYLYGVASTKPERKDLDWIREGDYEKLAEMILKPERKPDYGPAKPHPTAGATITGARKVMAGFNVNLGTADLKIAKKIAKALHASKGGFTNVKAMAATIPEKNTTQIGMSISDFERTPLYRVFETLKVECARYNVPIVGSEFCGMAPLKALIDVARYYLKVDNLTEDRVLEIAIQNSIEKGGAFE
jgi:glutamate formiminotransferase